MLPNNLRLPNRRGTRSVKIGDYILGKTIGAGTFASVRLAHHQKTGEQFAVKVIDRRKLDSQVYERQVRRESIILQALDHPNIVRLQRILKSRTCTYIFLEYVEGGELFQEIIDNIHLEEDTARTYFRQLTSAMTYAHERSIMHRDIKPENILLNEDKTDIKITDFGMGWVKEKNPASSAEREKEMMTTPCGTPKYMPPELLSLTSTGGRYCAAKIDVWSCGMVLFACLAGYLPYTGDTGNAMSILEQITARKEIEFPEWFSDGARDLLNRALEKDPAKRIDMRGLRDHAWTMAACASGGRVGAVGAGGGSSGSRGAVGRVVDVPGIRLDGAFGVRALDFTSPVTPGGERFEGDDDDGDAAALWQGVDRPER